MNKKKLAFVCVHNACCSQIAEAFGRKYLNNQYDVYSFGSEKQSQINQDAQRIMKEKYQIDMQNQYSKLFNEVEECDLYINGDIMLVAI